MTGAQCCPLPLSGAERLLSPHSALDSPHQRAQSNALRQHRPPPSCYQRPQFSLGRLPMELSQRSAGEKSADLITPCPHPARAPQTPSVHASPRSISRLRGLSAPVTPSVSASREPVRLWQLQPSTSVLSASSVIDRDGGTRHSVIPTLCQKCTVGFLLVQSSSGVY